MTGADNPCADDAISERAADYLARKHGGVWSDRDQAELEAWLMESTTHYVAWVRVEAIAARARATAAIMLALSDPTNCALPSTTASGV